jgi:hypothetical protein
MTTKYYEIYQTKFNETKPIRGRSVDVRPIGDRRRDWEQIIELYTPRGKEYAARLHNTDCVIYHADGSVTLQHKGWATNSTVDFINQHRPNQMSYAYRTGGHMWVRLHDGKEYLIPADGLTLRPMPDQHGYQPVNPTQVFQRRVSKQAIKEERERVMPFVKFATTLLKLSDGAVDGEHFRVLRREVDTSILSVAWMPNNEYKAREVLDAIANNEDKWDKLFYEVLRLSDSYRFNPETQARVYSINSVRQVVDKCLHLLPEIWHKVPMPMGTRPKSNIVI